MWWKRGEIEADAAVPRRRRPRVIGGHFPELVVLLLLGSIAPASAQNQGLVVRDGSIGSGPPGIVAPGIDGLGQPADYLIGADLGERRGSNLFHSFSRFSIGQGEVATFTGPDPVDGPQSVHHLVSRVTADNPSEIDGTLRSTIPGADFYLLNPAGVMFGPEAALDVPGSLHFGTSADLEFTTGERFEARVDGTIPLLAVAEPSEFGFLGDQAGPIRLEGSVLEHRGGLSMAAGSISFEAARVSTQPGSSGSGDISLLARDEITLAAAQVETSTDGNENTGSIRMTAPRVRLADGAVVGSSSFASGTGGDIVIVATEGVTLSGADAAGSVSRLIAGTAETSDSDGDDGSITVTTPVLRLEDGAFIGSTTSGAGDAGDIVIDASEDVFLTGVDARGSGSRILASTSGSGNAGSVRMTAPRVRLGDGAFVASDTLGSGTGGEVRLEVGELHLTDGSVVSAGTFGSGAGGDINIVAAEGVTFSGAGAAGFASVLATSEGDAGSIRVTTSVLRLEDGAVIVSSTSDAGDAGDIVIEASEDVVLSGVDAEGKGSVITAFTGGNGNAGSVRVTAPRVRLGDRAFVDSSALGSGTGGEVRFEVGELHLTGGSVVSGGTVDLGAKLIIVDSGFISSGTVPFLAVLTDEFGTREITGLASAPGALVIDADRLEVRRGSISASSFGASDAGEVSITVGELFLDGGSVSASASGEGSGGNVSVTAPLGIHLDDGSSISTSSVSGFSSAAEESLFRGLITAQLESPGVRVESLEFQFPEATGAAGEVSLDSDQVVLSGQSSISSSSTGSGRAGSVSIVANELRSTESSTISVSAQVANGGDVTITVADRVHLVDSTISADVGDGEGGNITIDPTFVILDHSEIVARAGEGTGGEITIVADALIKDPESLISASAGNPSLSGSVNINAPDVDLAASLAQLSDSALDASDAVSPPCSARRRGETPGSFVFSGRQGVPPGPEGALAAWPGDAPSSAAGGGGTVTMLADGCR